MKGAGRDEHSLNIPGQHSSYVLDKLIVPRDISREDNLVL
jgi:hypothetical protein